MIVGFGIIELWIGESRSLKEKRAILSRIIKHVQNNFNVSIAEVGDNDHWKKAKLGIGVVGNERSYVNGKIDHILQAVDNLRTAEVVNTKIEIIGLSDPVERTGYEDKYDELQES